MPFVTTHELVFEIQGALLRPYGVAGTLVFFFFFLHSLPILLVPFSYENPIQILPITWTDNNEN